MTDNIVKDNDIISNWEDKDIDFCHLHRHCEASIMDGVGKVEDGVEYAHKKGQPGVAITDHGSLVSWVRFYNAAREIRKKQNEDGKRATFKHVFGLEAYIVDDLKNNFKDRSYYHCTLLVKNETGFKNLLKLNNFAQREGFYYKPRIDWDTLHQHKEGIIMLSGCVAGKTCRLLLEDKYDEALNWNRLMATDEWFGNDYYLETMLSDFPEQIKCNKGLLQLSKDLDIPVVITGDAHYVRKEDYEAQKVMMLLKSKATMKELQQQEEEKKAAITRGDDSESEKRDKIWIFSSDQYWMKTKEEMIEARNKWHDYYPQEDINEHLLQSGKIAKGIDFVALDESPKMPKADIKTGEDPKVFFDRLLREAMNDKKMAGVKEYEDRLEMELSIIYQKDLIDYFIVNYEIIKWCKDNDIFVGPGRGSAGGSLVCYLLKITEIDPLKYDLLFERFLDLGRTDFPDIDIDFEIDERDRVKDYISSRYGKEHVASIAAMGTFRARNITRDTMRVYDFEAKYINEISKLVPADAIYIKETDNEGNADYVLNFDKRQCEDPEKLINFLNSHPHVKRIAATLFGQIRHISKHAAGVIVTDKPLNECVATIHVGKEVMTAWTEGIYRKELSQLNVLKLDILGLKNLSILKKACKLAGITYQSLLEVDVNDQKVYDKINNEKLLKGIFQFDTHVGKRLFINMKPQNFSHIIALAALDRPGPLDSGMAKIYIDRMNGRMPYSLYNDKDIDSVLGETYGVFVYQEQLMNLAKNMCGFTPMEASVLRKNLVKGQHSKEALIKEAIIRKELKEKFINGAIKNNKKKEQAESLWDSMEKFARYGFNKAHSVAYAWVSFWTMYMKVNYPLEFYSSLLSYSKEDEIEEIAKEMSWSDIDLQHPDINKSDIDFTVDRDHNAVLYGLKKIKYLGTKAQDAIIENRKFESFDDICEKIEKRVLNKRGKDALIRSGAFKSLEPDTGKLLQHHAQMDAKKNEVVQYREYSDAEQEKDERNFLGLHVSGKFTDKKGSINQTKLLKEIENSKELKERIDRNKEYFKDKDVSVDGGFISTHEIKANKKGTPMLVMKIDTLDHEQLMFFVQTWDNMYNLLLPLQEKQLVLFSYVEERGFKKIKSIEVLYATK